MGLCIISMIYLNDYVYPIIIMGLSWDYGYPIIIMDDNGMTIGWWDDDRCSTLGVPIGLSKIVGKHMGTGQGVGDMTDMRNIAGTWLTWTTCSSMFLCEHMGTSRCRNITLPETFWGFLLSLKFGGVQFRCSLFAKFSGQMKKTRPRPSRPSPA